jgi:hypothetical protein
MEIKMTSFDSNFRSVVAKYNGSIYQLIVGLTVAVASIFMSAMLIGVGLGEPGINQPNPFFIVFGGLLGVLGIAAPYASS